MGSVPGVKNSYKYKERSSNRFSVTMPSFQIFTNVAKADLPENIIEELTENIADILGGVPKKMVLIHIVPDQLMGFGGTTEPAAVCELGCIGKIGEDENKEYAVKLGTLIHEKLAVPADRMYITFTNLKREYVGWNCKTFAK